tara:strand:+ start:134 stop:718 length:585 start_codon:yes stop_codon:yes gene_type:complete
MIRYRNEVIQLIIDHYGYTSYLEIGIANSENYNSIRCQNKVSVDSALGKFKHANPMFKMKSDEFFERHAPGYQFDVIFIDGDHSKEQVRKDIANSLDVIDPKGTILLHDMNPPTKDMLSPRICGDGWEAFAELRTTRDDLNMFTHNDDLGVGVIQRGSQELYEEEIKSDWEFFSQNRNEVMKLIEWDQITENLV